MAKKECAICNGTGAAPGSHGDYPCVVCHGAGEVSDENNIEVEEDCCLNCGQAYNFNDLDNCPCCGLSSSITCHADYMDYLDKEDSL